MASPTSHIMVILPEHINHAVHFGPRLCRSVVDMSAADAAFDVSKYVAGSPVSISSVCSLNADVSAASDYTSTIHVVLLARAVAASCNYSAGSTLTRKLRPDPVDPDPVWLGFAI